MLAGRFDDPAGEPLNPFHARGKSIRQRRGVRIDPEAQRRPQARGPRAQPGERWCVHGDRLHRLARGRQHRDGIHRHFSAHLSDTDVKALTRALEKISTHARPLRPGRIRSSTP